MQTVQQRGKQAFMRPQQNNGYVQESKVHMPDLKMPNLKGIIKGAGGPDQYAYLNNVEDDDEVDRDLTLDGLRQVAARVFADD